MKKDRTVVGITAGTPTVFGFTPERREEAGRQFVDVGIAEEHAVAMASAIAAGGGKRYSECTALSSSAPTTSCRRTSVSTTIPH